MECGGGIQWSVVVFSGVLNGVFKCNLFTWYAASYKFMSYKSISAVQSVTLM